MRVISYKEFWETVRKKLGDEMYAEKVRGMWGDKAFSSADEAHKYWRNKTLPMMLEAARLNDCTGDRFTTYLEETLSAAVGAARRDQRIIADVDTPEGRRQSEESREELLAEEYKIIGERCAANHQCHINTENSFVCYCDEVPL